MEDLIIMIEEMIHSRKWSDLREFMMERPAPEVADLLLNLSKADRVLLFRLMPRKISAEVFSYIESRERDLLLADLSDEETRHLLANLRPDDRTELLEELPGQVTQRLLNFLNPEDLKEARQLLGYPEESVGRLMTPDYVAVRPDWTVAQALEHIRTKGRNSETINVIYVTDNSWKLIDALELRRFILAKPEETVEQIMDHAFVSLTAFDDREQAVHLIQKYDLDALPIVDSGGTLIGIVTVDDVLDVAQEEATEDFHKGAGVSPLKESIREVSIGVLYKKRVVWLLVLIVANLFSGAGIAYFEDTIASVLALVFFLPLLIDSAGNAGAQASTLMIRALAMGEVNMRDWASLLARELAVAAALGITMALAVWGVGVYRGGFAVGLVVALSMMIIVIVGSLIGMCLPFLLNRFRVDPATSSAPLVTSLADIMGVLIYFTIATWILRL